MEIKRKIRNGIYLVIDPSMNREVLLGKLEEIIIEEIAAVQIWDNFTSVENVIELINQIVHLCHDKEIPVLINNKWDLLMKTNLDGVHFDTVNENIIQLRNEIGRAFISGITCNNDLSIIRWADENGFDYISFCSMFTSSTANSCELVSFDTIMEANKITKLPLFLAGGIKPENMDSLNCLNYSGIAVVSGIMNADNSLEALKTYQQKIKIIQHEN